MTSAVERWAWAEVDLGALAHNVRVVAEAASPADLWAVVKADGYGHGAIPIAEAAIAAGARGLCVAIAAEALELRAAGLTVPVLVLSHQPRSTLPALIESGVSLTVYTDEHLAEIADAACAAARVADLHVKVDTGMHRVGIEPHAAAGLIERVASMSSAVRLAGVFTHLACADEPGADANTAQLSRFRAVLDALRRSALDVPIVHAANSAAALAVPGARFDIVRAGIALYGISPGPGVDDVARALRPVMSLTARVSLVKRVAAGDHVSYGWRHQFAADTTLATVPLGYADGVPRRLGTLPDQGGADVLVNGRRCPIVGVVTMDQLMIDVGDAGPVAIGDEVVLIGEQGGETIRAEEWAARLGTIGYEVVCGISRRVPRLVRPAPGVS